LPSKFEEESTLLIPIYCQWYLVQKETLHLVHMIGLHENKIEKQMNREDQNEPEPLNAIKSAVKQKSLVSESLIIRVFGIGHCSIGFISGYQNQATLYVMEIFPPNVSKFPVP
jgi:hypothetical protein